jgi:hypothetical protein
MKYHFTNVFSYIMNTSCSLKKKESLIQKFIAYFYSFFKQMLYINLITAYHEN